jgi:beta-alanine--pyruvate transaminase
MGGVFVQDKVYDAFMQGPSGAIELFHGYTYSGHPVAAAAGVAAMETYEIEGTFAQARSLEGHFEEVLHSFKGHPLVKDVRNFGLMGSIEMHSREGAPGARGMEMHKKCFWDEDLVIRNGMDILQFAPFLNSKPDEMSQSFEKIRKVMDGLA